MTRDLPCWGIWRVLGCLLLAYGLCPMLAGLALWVLLGRAPASWLFLLVTQAASLGTWLLVFWQLWRQHTPAGRSVLLGLLGLRPRPLRQHLRVLGQGLACLSLLLAVAYGVEALMAGPVTMKTPYHQVPTLDKWVLVGVALLVSPWLEELVYRGLLQGTWQRQMGPRSAWPVLGTLLLFTLSHADYRETPLAQGYVAMLGAVLGGMRYWSGSILPGVAVHAANNLVAAWGLLAR